jgi:hypothetical protein
MAYTQSDLDGLEKAIAKGILTVRGSDGRSVTYRTMNELKDAHSIVSKSLNKNKRPRGFIMRTNKGL